MNIYLVTNTTGFPNGTAAAKRIRMLGRAIIASGSSFSIFTGVLKHNQYNIKPAGSIDNIYYKYLHGTTELRVGTGQKILLYIKSIIALKKALQKMNPLNTIVYIYSHGDIYNIITLLLCRFYSIKTVEEINEWDYDEMKSPLRKFIFRVPMVKWSHGATVISQNIEENVLRINPHLKTLVIPVLDDCACYKTMPAIPAVNKYCFWMGLVDGYIEDVLFIIESCALAYKKGYEMDIVISGPCINSLEKIKEKMRSVNYPQNKLKMVGYVSDDALNRLCQNAFFYIVPLWVSQKSQNRFPTKIASFMFSGKPVLTCKIGEVGHLLTENSNVLFYTPGDSNDLANKIGLIYNDTILYDKICINAKQFALVHFDYDQYKNALSSFFNEILNAKKISYTKKSLVSHA